MNERVVVLMYSERVEKERGKREIRSTNINSLASRDETRLSLHVTNQATVVLD